MEPKLFGHIPLLPLLKHFASAFGAAFLVGTAILAFWPASD